MHSEQLMAFFIVLREITAGFEKKVLSGTQGCQTV
jgi:hypothetical protein